MYLGCTTILMPAMDFKNNTTSYFELVARNKCPTLATNYQTFDYAMSKISPAEQRQVPLQSTQNIMISVSSRTKPRFCK
jgi:hypothetical protein